MAKKPIQFLFGIHEFAAYDPKTGLPYGSSVTCKAATYTLSGELKKQTGGSSAYPHAIETGLIEAQLSITMGEHSDFIRTIALGNTPATNAAEASGFVSAATNALGTSAIDATTGIASATGKAGGESDLKFAAYAGKVVSATTVDIYGLNSVDFARGNNLVYIDDENKITAAPLTITTSATTEIPNTGIELTGGSGAIGMTIGDTLTFHSRPLTSGSLVGTYGSPEDIFPEFGAIITGEQRGNGQMTRLDIKRLKVIGMPLNYAAKEFGDAELAAESYRDETLNQVFTEQWINI
jgi:hypothetical protein